METFGVELLGFTAESGRKLLLSIALFTIVIVARRLLRVVLSVALRGERLERPRFWVRQALNIIAAAVIVLGMLSIWFDDPTRLTTAIGLMTAGLAFALQRVVTALAGYLVIMRGKTFAIGDRIVMGGVRGDVIALRFTQTTIMEMGQPPPVQQDEPAMWVKSRQYTGRLVTVSNARVFDEPVYNYTRELPYLWEEISIPIRYGSDRRRAEEVLKTAAEGHTAQLRDLSEEERRELERRYPIHGLDANPRVYYRLTDNWLELAVRFLVADHQIREVKDAISRDILAGLEAAGIDIASTTFEIARLPRLEVALDGEQQQRARRVAR